MARVVLENVSKSFPASRGQTLPAVCGVNLDVADGEFLALVGPSGCGKSTTLRLIAGLEDLTAGRISIDGRVVNDVEPKDRDVAMVFQNYALYPHLTVFDNMAFGLVLRKVPKADIHRRVHEAAVTLDLGACLDRLPKALSGGQRQRVALGRALVRQPKVFLLDEPLSNLDAQMRVQMRAELARLHQRLGATMILVTHDQAEAMTLGRRIVVMKGGSIQQVAAPLTLYHRPANLFVAGFIGSPPMNRVAGTLVREGVELRFRPLSTPAPDAAAPSSWRFPPDRAAVLTAFAGRDIVLGVRPEDVSPATDAADGDNTLRATVEVIEPMGAEAFIHLTAGGQAWVARVPGTASVSPRAAIQLRVDLARAHLFDPASGEALVHGTAGI